MIAFVDGAVAKIEEDALVIDVGGIGYRVFVPAYMIERAQMQERLRVYTHQHVREDALLLYGFPSDDDRKLFMRLQNASGVGPKLAMQILSNLYPSDIVRALMAGDVAVLTRVPGVGAKTAQRMVLELKDRLDDLRAAFGSPASSAEGVCAAITSVHGKVPTGFDDIQAALYSLGYSEKEVGATLADLADELRGLSVSEGVKRALRAISR